MNIVRAIFCKIRAHFEILKKGWGDLPLFPSSGKTKLNFKDKIQL